MISQVLNRFQKSRYIAYSTPRAHFNISIRNYTGDEGLAPWSRLAVAASKTPQAALVAGLS